MAEEIINYIRENLAKGVPQDQIRQSLLTNGWKQVDIDSAFLQLEAPPSSLPPFPIKPPSAQNPPLKLKEQKSFLNPKILLALIAIFLLLSIGGGSYFLFFTNEQKETQEKNQGTWKIYTNTEFGYKLEIPPDWAWKEFPSEDTDGYKAVVFGNEKLIPNIRNYTSVEDMNNIQVLRVASQFSLENYLENLKWGDGQVITVGGLGAHQYNKPFTNDQSGVVYVTTFVKHGEDILIIAGNFVPPAFSPVDKVEQDELKRIYDRVLASIAFSQKSPSQESAEPLSELDTSRWTTYTNPEFGYSLKIPPEWKEVVTSSNQQKRFRLYVSQETSSDETGSFEAELQILTLSFDNPAVTGKKSDFDRFRTLSEGTEEIINGVPFKKIDNINLDGCEAPQFFFNEGNYRYGYSTSCNGSTRYISILLLADQQNIVEKHKSVYDAIVKSFKFNQFKL